MKIKTEQIKSIVESTVNENPMSHLSEFRTILQKNLDTNLEFETKVSEVEVKNGFIVTQICYVNEEVQNIVVDATISPLRDEESLKDYLFFITE